MSMKNHSYGMMYSMGGRAVNTGEENKGEDRGRSMGLDWSAATSVHVWRCRKRHRRILHEATSYFVFISSYLALASLNTTLEGKEASQSFDLCDDK